MRPSSVVHAVLCMHCIIGCICFMFPNGLATRPVLSRAIMHRRLKLHVIRYNFGGGRRATWGLDGQHSIAPKEELVTNERIVFPTIRLLAPDEDGKEQNMGVVSRELALEMARQQELDLVVVRAEASPPVCRLVNVDKMRYDATKKKRESKRSHSAGEIKKIIKLSVGISEHDYKVRVAAITKALSMGEKIRAIVRLASSKHPEVGLALLDRMAKDVAALGAPTAKPVHQGMNMDVVYTPKPQISTSANSKPG